MKAIPNRWLILLLLGLLALGLGGWRILRQQDRLLRLETEQALASIASLKSAEIKSWRETRMADTRILTGNPTVMHAVAEWEATKPDDIERRESLLEIIRRRFDLVQQAYDYLDVRMVDCDGRVVLSASGSDESSEDEPTRRAVLAARKAGGPVFGELHRQNGLVPVLDVAAPLKVEEDDGSVRDSCLTLVIQIDPGRYLYPLLRTWPTPSKTAETLLIRREGDRIVFLNDLRHRKDAALSLSFSADTPDLPAAMAARGFTGVTEGRDYRGVPVLAVVLPIAGTPWIMISKIDSDEAFAGRRRENLMGMLVLLMAAVAVVAVVLVIWYEGTLAHERKLTEATQGLHAREARLAGVFLASPSGIAIVRDRVLLDSNAALPRMVGYERDEVVGQSSRRLYLSDEDFQKAGADALRQIAEKGRAEVETRWQTKGGRILDILLIAAPVDPGERQGDIVFTATDVTERKRQANRLVAHAAELERSNQELATFAYVASHDLRSPLRGISQLAEWIAEDMGGDLPAEVANHIRLMRNRVERMEGLLDDLLTYSRVGRIEGDLIRVDVAELARQTFDFAAPPPGFTLELGENLPTFVTLATPFTQVLRNLVGNAIKHHDRDHGVVRVTAEEGGRGFVFSVSDDGPGIPPEFHEKVFGLFQTLRSRDQVEGSGMGLAIVKKTVEIYGGRVSLESDGKRGTTFRFTWPGEKNLKEILDARGHGQV